MTAPSLSRRMAVAFTIAALLGFGLNVLAQNTVVTNPRITGVFPTSGGGSALVSGQTVAVGTGTATATVGGVLTTSVTQACTTAVTTEETLWTYSLPANTLTAGRVVRLTAWGFTAANANVKTPRLKFGVTTVEYVSTTLNNIFWRLTADVLRISDTTQTASGTVFYPPGTTLLTSPTATLSGDVPITVTGQNGTASANDICVRGAIVEVL